MATDEARKDLEAAVAARRELGVDYEPEVLDAFLEKIDARIDQRIDAGVAQRTAPQQPVAPPKDDNGGLALAIVSIGAGIPITAIAAQEGTFAVIVAWGGIVGVNLARAISRWARPL